MNHIPNKLELHYFLKDHSHSIDAFVKNGCERDLLLILKELTEKLDININIESEVYLEGGFKEIWKFLGKNNNQLALIVSILALIIATVPKENKKLTELEIENFELDNQMKRLQIKKLEEELNQEQIEKLAEKIVPIFNQNYKVLWYKSNFYKKLVTYSKVKEISVTQLDKNNQPLKKEEPISKTDFYKFILNSNEFTPEINDEAVINIISPVLLKGKFKWKGFYENEIITFYMKDEIFKSSVRNNEIEFTNGTSIKCVLKQKRIINEFGLIKTKSCDVLLVLEVMKKSERVTTEQGKKYKRNKSDLKNQTKLDI
ncbi:MULTISPECIES: hypothetical protein [Tenacibaculum]|uniref:hypothetical protein n=1 Tax=Tenacibaculum TaxID=104267 RepID=UPI001F0B3C2F|nr:MULTISPECIES: hypothetical protein [Tenacibaculum]MCH3882990.1 hypothetical protein [Tenacibaculum aquimarinum]MDO6601049.1 hypothetical protein [Tenacibaculum sp. 1_MG-2023]